MDGANLANRRRVLKSLALAAVAGPFPFRWASAATGETLRIGASLPLTGPEFFVEDGLRQLLGYRLWQEEVNAGGGLQGREVELVIYDDGSTAEGGAKAYRRLIEEDRVDLLLGNYGSGVAKGTIPVVEAAELPCVFPMAWQPALWLEPRRWAVPTLPLATDVTRPLVEYLAKQGVSRIAVINADNAYARDLSKGLVQWIETSGLELTARREYSFGDEARMKAAIQNAIATNPDALAGGNVGDSIPELARVARMAEPGLAHYAWFELDEPTILPHREVVEGMVGFGLWLPTMPYPGNREFVGRFTRRWQSEHPEVPVGFLLDHHAAAGYGAGQVLEAAVEAAGSLAPGSVRDALLSFETSTVFGPYRLDERGIQIGKVVPVVAYRHGLREVVWPPELST